MACPSPRPSPRESGERENSVHSRRPSLPTSPRSLRRGDSLQANSEGHGNAVAGSKSQQDRNASLRLSGFPVLPDLHAQYRAVAVDPNDEVRPSCGRRGYFCSIHPRFRAVRSRFASGMVPACGRGTDRLARQRRDVVDRGRAAGGAGRFRRDPGHRVAGLHHGDAGFRFRRRADRQDYRPLRHRHRDRPRYRHPGSRATSAPECRRRSGRSSRCISPSALARRRPSAR